MDQLGRILAGIEDHLAADDPVLAEAFVLWDERCAEAVPGAAGHGEAPMPAWTSLRAAAAIPRRSVSGAVRAWRALRLRLRRRAR